MRSPDAIIRKQNMKSVREEIARRLTERGFKIIPKTAKKIWAVKSVTKKEIKQIINEITCLLEVTDLDGGAVKPVSSFSYALLSETRVGAAGISIEI